MKKLEISAELLQRLKKARGELKRQFELLRVRSHNHDTTATERLDRGTPFLKRTFEKDFQGKTTYEKKITAAWKLHDFLSGITPLSEYALSGLNPIINNRIADLISSDEWKSLARDLKSLLSPDTEEPSATAFGQPTSTVPTAIEPAPVAPPLVDPPGSHGQKQSGVETGKTTGRRGIDVSELFYAAAEWRDTNLGPDEGRWLQLFLKFGQGYTLHRPVNRRLEIELHRIHIAANLDGGSAKSRDSWTEFDSDGQRQVEIFESNEWIKERPCYDVDNPLRSSPLSGKYGFFDFYEVTGEVGQDAVVEVSMSIGGISISLPDEVAARLDPDRKNDHDTPEKRLIQGWIRDREIPRSDLYGGGRYRLATIQLHKVQE